MSEVRAEVEILGQRLSVRGQGPVEHIQSLADYLDGRIRVVREQARVYDPIRLALLGGLHVAEDLFRVREREAHLVDRLDELRTRLAEALREPT